MFRILLFMATLSIGLLAESINFSEEKYHEALESTFHKTGTVNFLKDSMEIKYDGDERLLIYQDDLLITQEGEQRDELDLTTRPDVKIFFMLFEAVFFDKKEILEDYFDLEEKTNMTVLTPNSSIRSYVEEVSYKKIERKLKFLQINLTTEDTIRIEEIDEVR